MKADELTLGDYVQVNGEVCNVISISYFDIGISDSKEDFYHEHIDNIKPIPLTAEILGKNFSFSPYNDEGAIEHYYLLDDYYDVEISEYTDDLWEVVADEVEMSCLPTWKMYVCHVHELQHALRLCGIEKEIEL